MQNHKSKRKITDNPEEVFDIVDENDKIIKTAARKEVHGNPKLIHRSIGVVIFNRKGEIFLQQRSATKDTDPLKWTISCSGHVESGHSYEDSAHRELSEELGVDQAISPVEKFIFRAGNETEMVMLYRAFSEGPFTLLKKEIKQGRFLSKEELERLLEKKEIELNEYAVLCLNKIGWENDTD